MKIIFFLLKKIQRKYKIRSENDNRKNHSPPTPSLPLSLSSPIFSWTYDTDQQPNQSHNYSHLPLNCTELNHSTSQFFSLNSCYKKNKPRQTKGGKQNCNPINITAEGFNEKRRNNWGYKKDQNEKTEVKRIQRRNKGHTTERSWSGGEIKQQKTIT